MHHVSHEHGNHDRVYLVSGIARFDEQGRLYIELSNSNFKPVMIVEGVARIPALSVTSLVITDPNVRYWGENPSAQRVTLNNVSKRLRRLLRNKHVRIIVEVVDDEKK